MISQESSESFGLSSVDNDYKISYYRALDDYDDLTRKKNHLDDLMEIDDRNIPIYRDTWKYVASTLAAREKYLKEYLIIPVEE
jgi:hypothetical protein